MEKHYVCKGECGGVSDTPGVCKAGDCSHSDKDLAECNCDDSAHKKDQESKEENQE